MLNQLYLVYAQAAGTAINAAPADGDYTTYNIVADGAAFFGGSIPAINPDDFVFTEPIGLKWLYPITTGGLFDYDTATPRVDMADTDFQLNFEQVPLVSPAAATAGDRTVSFIELFCLASADDAAP